MSTTTTAPVLSEASVELYSELCWERMDVVPTPADLDGISQRQLSARIDVLKSRPALPATDEQKAAIAQIGHELFDGTDNPFDEATIAVDRAGAKAQLRTFTKMQKGRDYAAVKDEQAAAMDEWLVGRKGDDDSPIPF